MAEKDALRDMDKFNRMTGSGLFIKFRADVPLVLRVLTTDPVISESEFTNKQTGEITLSTRFAFIVYNFTEEKAQIMQVSPAMARKIGEIHSDPDFGANIRNIDIKITPTGEGLERRYDIQVLPKPRTLTREMITEAQAINLDDKVKDNKGRMSDYDPDYAANKPVGSGGSAVGNSGYAAAKAKRDELHARNNPEPEDDIPPENLDDVVEDIGDEPINLDDIPF